tara:strand:- start:4331 stop:5425 length:1095 start_codon:yes stop_codon:yes gene_type:complete
MKKLVLLLLVLFLLSACSDDSVVYQAPMFNIDNCEDTDGGANIEEYGEVTYVDGDMTIIREDLCADSVFLIERKCQRNRIKNFRVNCSLFDTFCVDGACVGIDLDEEEVEEILEEEAEEVEEEEVEEIEEEEGLCTETDGGQDYYNYGQNEGYMAGTWTTKYDDLCRGSPNYDLVEYYCEGDDIIAVTVDVPEDYLCVDGAFVLKEEHDYTCTDSDGGHDYYTYGLASGYIGETWYEDTYDDQCSGYPDFNLIEYYCDEDVDEIKGISVEPPEGYICDGGIFVLEEEYVYTCTETDGGQDYYNYGQNEGYIGGAWSTTYDDMCRGEPYNDLIEYYCDEETDEIKGVPVDVPEGYVCEDGAFVEA